MGYGVSGVQQNKCRKIFFREKKKGEKKSTAGRDKKKKGKMGILQRFKENLMMKKKIKKG